MSDIPPYPTPGGSYVQINDTPLGSGGPTLRSWECHGCGAGVGRGAQEIGSPAAKRLVQEAADHSLKCTGRR
ncbi:hypothetical protein [Kitasatospora purpeofusca]|uniref:hypothetical protein n=1 Tax=Kitasatospora purpeofusca TaxID=67352 RepID=UPI003828B084